MKNESLVIISAVLAFVFTQLFRKRKTVITDAKVLLELNKKRREEIKQQEERIKEIEDEIAREIQVIERDIEGAAARLRDEFGTK